MQRTGDAHIMDIMINSQAITQEQIRKIYYYRKYLRVTTLTDITTSDGKAIIAEVFNGKREKPMDNNIISELEWPQQQKPSWRTRELWTSALRSALGQWHKHKFIKCYRSKVHEQLEITGVTAEIAGWSTTDIEQHNNELHFLIPCKVQKAPDPAPHPTLFIEYIQRLPLWEKTLLTHLYENSSSKINLKAHIECANN
eukprot:3067841-Ditylum_brightwellii.AAC.2